MNSSNTSSPKASASLKVVGQVDHSIKDSEKLIMVPANSSQIIMNSHKFSDDDEAAHADHSHSTVSSPDKDLPSVTEIPVGDKSKEPNQAVVSTPAETQSVVVGQEAKAKIRSSKRRGRAARAARAEANNQAKCGSEEA